MSTRTSPSKWWQIGHWPSEHDLDLVLDADDETYRPLERLVATLEHPAVNGRHERLTVPVQELPLRADLLNDLLSFGAETGLPLDVFLVPWPRDFSIAAWIAPPFETAEIRWAATLGKSWFVDPRRPIQPGPGAVA